ncbi:PTS N-acetyl-D-glucosamine transporter [Sphingomonas koreensis]|jgi:PTS system N-acetylglucosamine-specific IIC component|uniref:PTS N-acetyl-D-glucosamine transporter n=1 Tax=Sphingomonas koreensis TaxID=93064 RepID=A0A1L6J8M2_9SPHN|nr:N-acetylglucosamine-specific PTS transporter subunit IIBC [Sphingomonas koreensis]APR52197.1 PTS N-acetyl-D-glucosamine transporter [Sphingomonas koreensis]MDC7812302.1 N-acetylglucosamine-specific PTS transporter subunit IIBC [Sphingomonas koreensis]RSU23005.1 PTS N-acetyl-D-glucosamine transporter [Sphingomonas koreensis]RSU26869.1 PTS N-acetyl-D-glucosamine transporter [Sphingomonas koreensis]RSU30523.1 PTS N-acetyl-D-glucosamine transporter [Sphingomonas koreensis]
MRKILETLQPLGRALMLPIAVLPVAGLLLRIGQPDLLDIAFVSAAGTAIFGNLGILFAIGVAVGFARDGNGAAALAGVTCYLVSTTGAQTFLIAPPEVVAGLPDAAGKVVAQAWATGQIDRLEVPIGIISGLIGGKFYNRFATIALPEYLAFFGGRRFVPIAAGIAGLLLAGVLGYGYAHISSALDAASHAVVESGGAGMFVYGVLNRLLLVTGLHHLLNNVAWFLVGDFGGATGDLGRFFAGDPNAGAFMSGFFPVMMFGLPAACLAMYHEARPERRKAVGGMLFSLAFTSFLTGVTEPIEFTFMFLAPVLYAIHAVLTGVAMTLMDMLGIKLGFGFSAGLFDYVLNFKLSTRPWMLLPVGAAYAVIYYTLFRFFIRKLDLATPGREKGEAVAAAGETAAGNERGAAFVKALGGAANLTSVDACTTRLRLIVADQSAVDDAALNALGARGIIRPSANATQVVLGPIADLVAEEIRGAIGGGAAAVSVAPAQALADEAVTLPAEILAALGGEANIRALQALHGRFRVEVVDAARTDEASLLAAANGAVSPQPGVYHILHD